MADNSEIRKQIAELKSMIATLKASHKAMLRKDLEPLQKRVARLEAQALRKRR